MNFAYTEAEARAKHVLEQCGLTDPAEFTIGEIILGRKAFYREASLKGKEGEIVSYGGKAIITVNSDILYDAKKRFAAAHELGHFELHRDLVPIFTDTEEDLLSWYKGGPHEIAANQFAAEFLMPSEIFHKQCTGKKFDASIIDSLAKRFKVSKTAAILRFVTKGNHPVFVAFCKDNVVKWWKKSEDFYHFLSSILEWLVRQGPLQEKSLMERRI